MKCFFKEKSYIYIFFKFEDRVMLNFVLEYVENFQFE